MLSDLQYAWRRLRRTPAFSLTAVLTLALGIGTATAVFGVVDALTFRPVAGVQLDGAYALAVRGTQKNKRIEIPWSVARELHRRIAADGIRVAIQAGYWTAGVETGDRSAQSVSAASIGGDFADVYGLRAQHGRWLTADDDDNAAGSHAAVISDRLWRDWYGGRPEIVGQALMAVRFSRDVVRVRVVGVAAPGVRGMMPQTNFTDLWISHAAVRDGFAGRPQIDTLAVHTIVRPPAQAAPVATAASVKTTLASVMPALDRDVTTVTLAPIRLSLNPDSMSPLRLASLAVSLLVLAAACANLANMLLARGAHRAGEVAIRLALGANRIRIARIFVAEIALIAGSAAITAVVFAVIGLRVFGHAVPNMSVGPGVELTPDLTLNVRMLVYALLASAAASAIVGVIAAWRGSATRPGRMLAASSVTSSTAPRARVLRTGMVSIQITVALVLVMAAGLYLETMIVKLIERGIFGRRVNYDTSRVAAARIDLAPNGFSEARGRYVLDRMLAAVRRLPDVEAVAIASGLPGALHPLAAREMYLVLDDTATALGGHPGRGAAEYLSVSPGFLATIGLPVRLGRDFQASDEYSSERVAILSQRAAEILWPDENPLGKRIAGPSNQLPTGNRWSSWAVAPPLMTVIGIVDEPVTPNQLGPYSAASQFVFVPFAQHYTPIASIVVRTSRPEALESPLRQTVRAIDPEVPLLDMNTVDSTVLAWIAPMRAATLLAGSLAALSLGIAALGVYGVISFFTSARTREFGIRLALGATPRQVTKLVLDDAVRLVLIGLLPGVFIASVGSRYVEARLFGIMPNSITNWVIVPIVVLVTGIVAAYLPARRASRADPTLTLRAQ